MGLLTRRQMTRSLPGSRWTSTRSALRTDGHSQRTTRSDKYTTNAGNIQICDITSGHCDGIIRTYTLTPNLPVTGEKMSTLTLTLSLPLTLTLICP